MEGEKKLSERQILIPILYYIDDDGKKVYDYEGMLRDFETKMNTLIISQKIKDKWHNLER